MGSIRQRRAAEDASPAPLADGVRRRRRGVAPAANGLAAIRMLLVAAA
jgi:hypothetical protein